MKLLNFGCGNTYHSDWENIDLVSNSSEVKAHDIRKNFPYPDALFDACYSSHVLEHLKQEEAQKIIQECYRVIKPTGIIRVVVPDLETIAREYLIALDKVDSGIEEAEFNYDWMMLELYDQTVRTRGGGEMQTFLLNPNNVNNPFVTSRIGFEAEKFWKMPSTPKSTREKLASKNLSWLIRKFRAIIARYIIFIVAGDEASRAFDEGVFRNSGEIHRWMYDRYSMRRLLERVGFIDVHVCRADESQIPDFNHYGLDMIDGKVRKPDSLFIEARKP